MVNDVWNPPVRSHSSLKHTSLTPQQNSNEMKNDLKSEISDLKSDIKELTSKLDRSLERGSSLQALTERVVQEVDNIERNRR